MRILANKNLDSKVMNVALKNISIEIPVTDISFIETLIRKMGWTLKSQEDVIIPVEETEKKIDISRKYSSRIMYLRSLHGKGIKQRDIENDERLAYLLNR